jgi:hypothetical protein
MLQDSVIAERNGRPVLAVKAGAASQLTGLVHDSSASGQTVFLEPREVIELGNQLRDLEGQERELERAVRAELSALVGAEAEALLALQAVLTRLDAGLARARYGAWLGAVRPELAEAAGAPAAAARERPAGGAGERGGGACPAGGGDHRAQHRRQDGDPQERRAGGVDGPRRAVSALQRHAAAALVRPGAGRYR